MSYGSSHCFLPATLALLAFSSSAGVFLFSSSLPPPGSEAAPPESSQHSHQARHACILYMGSGFLRLWGLSACSLTCPHHSLDRCLVHSGWIWDSGDWIPGPSPKVIIYPLDIRDQHVSFCCLVQATCVMVTETSQGCGWEQGDDL